MYKFIINKEKCVNCGICADICKTARVYRIVDGKVEAAFKDKCWECGQCAAACPKSAIEYKRPSESIESSSSLTQYLRARRSARLFTDKPVSRKTVEELLDCTRWIPSAQNKCDVQWVCIDNRERIKLLSKETVETFRKTAGILKNPALKPVIRIALGYSKYKQAMGNISSFENLAQRYDAGEDPIFYNAPVLLFAVTPAGSYFGRENSIYAGYNLMLKASESGLSTCRIGYFDVALERNKSLQDIVLGKNHGRRIQTTIILGYSKYRFYNLIDRESIKINWDKL